MANRQYFPSQSSANEHKRIFGSFVGNSTSAPTTVAGCVSSVARSDVGELTITFDDAYPTLLHYDFKIFGTTTEKKAFVVDTILTDWASNQIKIEVRNGETDAAVDLTTAESVYIALDVKNSSTGVI